MKENDLPARSVFLSSNNPFWFKCNLGHEFKSRPLHITQSNSWCSACAGSAGEQDARAAFVALKILFEAEYSFINSPISTLRFDFYFKLWDQEWVVEVDGVQHFKATPFFDKKQSFEERKRIDLVKTRYCIDNNILILRIDYSQKNMADWIGKFLARENHMFSDPNLYAAHIHLKADNIG
jgi:hypothetical protein